jgi:hypothetical protein
MCAQNSSCGLVSLEQTWETLVSLAGKKIILIRPLKYLAFALSCGSGGVGGGVGRLPASTGALTVGEKDKKGRVRWCCCRFTTLVGADTQDLSLARSALGSTL